MTFRIFGTVANALFVEGGVGHRGWPCELGCGAITSSVRSIGSRLRQCSEIGIGSVHLWQKRSAILPRPLWERKALCLMPLRSSSNCRQKTSERQTQTHDQPSGVGAGMPLVARNLLRDAERHLRPSALPQMAATAEVQEMAATAEDLSDECNSRA